MSKISNISMETAPVHDGTTASDIEKVIGEAQLGRDDEPNFSDEEERRVLRKIDWFILPVLCLAFLCQYIDKQSLSYAAIFNLRKDLGLSPTQYSWSQSIFFFGQLTSELTIIYFMSRLPLIKLVGYSIILWGGVCMCLAAPKNFAGFTAIRYVLGFTEGVVYPAFVTITSIWYRKEKHATRTGIWVSMNGLAQVLGSLLMYGIGKNESLPLAPWRTMFLVCGGATIACGFIWIGVIPANPQTAWFFTEREKQYMARRMAEDREGGDRNNFDMVQFKEACLDPKAWLTVLFGFLITMVSPVLIFASLVINDLGYDKFDTMLYTSPSGAVQIFFIWVGVAACAVFPRYRLAVCSTMSLVPLAGSILLLKLDVSAGWGLIAASWLASSVSCVMSIFLSISASNVKGNTKRSTVNTSFFIGYCVGAIAGPQIWVKPPRYKEGVITAVALWVLWIVSLGAYFTLCYGANKSKEQKLQAGAHGHVDLYSDQCEDMKDFTDKQDPHFRYSY